MSEPTVTEAIDNNYASLQSDNADIDEHIATLKRALAREGAKEAVFDPTKLAQNNRSGRKMMQAYFRQRGVSVKGLNLVGRLPTVFERFAAAFASVQVMLGSGGSRHPKPTLRRCTTSVTGCKSDLDFRLIGGREPTARYTVRYYEKRTFSTEP